MLHILADLDSNGIVNTPNKDIVGIQIATAIISTYLLLLSFVVITIAAICFVFNFKKSGFLLFSFYGFVIFVIPMHVTNIIGPVMFCVGLIGLIKAWKEGSQKV